ncbi:hypothetical protein N9O21_03820 [Rhodobacteraceae bacterium]|nr:hypothetical protein [Paracoccaceae bacterium]
MRCHKRALKFRRETPFNQMIETVHGRTVARATCKPKAKVYAAMGIARDKKLRCAKLQDHPATAIGRTALI